MEQSATSSLLRLTGITKAYPGVLANDAVDLSIRAGEIQALLGENGAGKSTLVKVVYGLLQADAGGIRWRGQSVDIESPAHARQLGIAMVFQHFSLFDSLSVLENVALGMGIDADAALAKRIVTVSERYGLPLEPARSVYTLSVGERQRIEIVRCLLQAPKLLIMDEPTSVLTPAEVDTLFATLRRLAGEGVAILYISHKLDEIRALCDSATILRGGRRVAEADPARATAHDLARLMMGDAVQLGDQAADARGEADAGAGVVSAPRSARLGQASPQPLAARGPVRLATRSLDLPADAPDGQALHGIDLSVAAGELVGIAGVAGNGQDELLAALAGERLASLAAQVWLDEVPIGHRGPGERRRSGLCAVPEERLGHGAVPELSLSENALLTAHHRAPVARRGPLFDRRAAQAFAEKIIERFDVRCDGPGSLAASLSGGNLQKFVVGREILQSPGVLVVSQPTWGVDAGAAATIHRALRALAAEGAAVLLISQDLDELMSLCDRIGALCAGRLSAFYATRDVDVRQVGLLMGGAATLEAVA